MVDILIKIGAWAFVIIMLIGALLVLYKAIKRGLDY